eukprot:SAG31_NODE_197_length_20660_cov_8.861368_18_plen_232_part_00
MLPCAMRATAVSMSNQSNQLVSALDNLSTCLPRVCLVIWRALGFFQNASDAPRQSQYPRAHQRHGAQARVSAEPPVVGGKRTRSQSRGRDNTESDLHQFDEAAAAAAIRNSRTKEGLKQFRFDEVGAAAAVSHATAVLDLRRQQQQMQFEEQFIPITHQDRDPQQKRKKTRSSVAPSFFAEEPEDGGREKTRQLNHHGHNLNRRSQEVPLCAAPQAPLAYRETVGLTIEQS